MTRPVDTKAAPRTVRAERGTARSRASNAAKAETPLAPLNGRTAQKAGELVAPNAHTAQSAKAIEKNPWIKFSDAPDVLADGLAKEVESAFAFARELKQAFTFFGGARIDPKDPFFKQGEAWGEAVLLTNVLAERPDLARKAVGLGLFSETAVRAARASCLGVCAGLNGCANLGLTLAGAGGLSDPGALSVALGELERTDPADAQLLLTLTRTGAGPGMMEAVPLGYLDARKKLAQLLPDEGQQLFERLATQGSRIKLPFEQETSPTIERLRQFVHFLPRRLALTEQAAGFVVFPGGFGTLNELFEVLRDERAVVLHGEGFWKPMVDAMVGAWRARGLVDEKLLSKLAVVDGVEQGLPLLIQHAKQGDPPAKPTAERAKVIAQDIQRGLATLSRLPPAVTFLGGRELQRDDMEIGVAKQLAAKLARSGIPARAGGHGALLDAVSDGVKSAAPDAAVQALLYDHGDLSRDQVARKADVYEVVHSAPVHKLLLYENTDAIVALPGGIGTMDEVWEVACLMQTRKLPVRPLILVGKAFWQPFLDAVEKAMSNGDRKTISPGDMKLFQVVDDPEEAARLVRQHRAGNKPFERVFT